MQSKSLALMDDYVSSLGGKRAIRKILIANNGIAAVKAIRSIRRWAYESFGDERAILFVAMATPEDVTANAEYVRMADIWTSVPGGSNNRNFANVALIADIAHRFSCDAVWAGWGHASENPALPAALTRLGIIFLGPPPDSMHALGDKIASTIIAQSAGVPTVAWSGSGLNVDYAAEGSVGTEIYQSACINDADHALRAAKDCGYPLVVKASEGGGGKGIRVVFDESSICRAFGQVVAEVPGSPIFIMRLVQNARHLEVQIVADEFGDAIALYGRDCSVQRRHQKIIEEGPVVAAPPHIWKRLEQGAVALAKEVGYIGAGTVEYLYKGSPTDGEFFFLELNPRLQVEHPVTEWITGVNLPALQVHIAMGIPLRNVASIRKFLGLPDLLPAPKESLGPSLISAAPMKSPVRTVLEPPKLNSNVDDLEPLSLSPLPPQGHVIACRVTAENPDEGFQPTSGAIQELTFRNTPNVWGYFSVGASGGVHEFADSQFGHLFAWGETREASRRCLVLALKELSIRGDIRTTVEYLIKLLEMKAFRENTIDTSWLDSLIAEKVVAEKPPTDLAIIIGAVCRAHMDFTGRADSFTKCLERGQLPPLDTSLVSIAVELIYEDVKYSFTVTRSDISSFRVRLTSSSRGMKAEGKSVLAEIRTLADGAKLVLADGRSHVCYIMEEPSGLRMSIDGKTCLFPKEYDPTTLSSSVSGKLVRFLVDTDDHVMVGQPYVELEVMKMYLTLSTPESGKITVVGSEGSSVEIGDVLAKLELDDPTKVRCAEDFKGELPEFSEPQALGMKAHQLFHHAQNEACLLLRGFDASTSAMEDLMSYIDDARVCAGEIREALSSLTGRVPSFVAVEIESQLKKMLSDLGHIDSVDLGKGEKLVECFSINGSVEKEAEKFRQKQVLAISSAVRAILVICEGVDGTSELIDCAAKYASGSIFASTMSNLMDEYLYIEKHFARRAGGAADALFTLRDRNKNDLSSIVEVAASHICLKEKNAALLNFLEILSRPACVTVLSDENAQTAEFKAKLHNLSQLYAPEYSDIALRARMILADLRRPHFQHRKDAIADVLPKTSASQASVEEKIQRLVTMGDSILDVLLSFIVPSSNESVSTVMRSTAATVHILRSYRTYEVKDLSVAFVGDEKRSDSPLTAEWKFRFSKRDDAHLPANPRNGLAAAERQRPIGLTSFDSADNLAAASGIASDDSGEEPFRHGLLAAFSNWSSMELEFDKVLEGISSKLDWSRTRDVNVMSIILRWDSTAPSKVSSEQDNNDGEGPENFRDFFASEASVSQALTNFCRSQPSRMKCASNCGIKAFTFIVAPLPSNESVTYPGCYTLRVKNDFREDPIYRHIDPPMAFQLELSRLSNFSITRFPYPTRSVHVFFAQDKSVQVDTRSGSSAGLPPLQSNASKEPRRSGGTLGTPSDPVVPINTSSDGRKGKSVSEGKKRGSHTERDVDARFFVRAVIRHADVISSARDGSAVSIPEAERTFIEALDAVEMANCDRRLGRTDFNHIFLNVIPAVKVDIDDVEAICRRMFNRYAPRCWSLRVFAVEIKISALISLKGEGMSIIPLRFLLFNPTGHDVKVESYVESVDPQTGLSKILSVAHDNSGSQQGTLVSKPYPVMDRIQRKRVMAQAMDTTYVYDFLHIFNKQLQLMWRRYSEDRLLGGFHRHKIPLTLVETNELILADSAHGSDEINKQSPLVEANRQPGMNDIGVVVWRCTLKTPEYPDGRDVIIIANDITFKSGSFGPLEDSLFYEASKYAREHKIPRIYLAANSGARIGVAEEVRDRLQVNWVDPKIPTKGFKSLGVNEKDLKLLSSYVKTKEAPEGDIHEITDIIGAEHGLGVENLMGSGLLAGEASRAYDETFTITYVCSRSVGIGAYLVRLGQRVIQKQSSAPIILTGYSALNKVLGHDVYLSNDQLGGTKVMQPNGVTHSVVNDDVEGVGAILQWLSYVPSQRGGALPIIESRDAVHRTIAVRPPRDGQPYNPRTFLIAGGIVGEDKTFMSGLFDKDSWKEYLEGWAKTVVVGRARLGGVPTGVVAVETRCVDKLTPADPASPDTRETIVTQAGQVWYPDSAAKTAQAIRDFDREGLPLFILANWRGFSGGMRDMFDEVLKSGSLIVDALRSYQQPVFVYIPPGGELRGGAWVVLDTLINPSMIEMYAAQDCRGGVLEPEGTVDVKYRRRHLIMTMHRLDEELRELDEELGGDKPSGGLLSDERKQAIHDAIYAREAKLLPVYRNIATAFCDLHDTPGRMVEKNAVRRIVDWEHARNFFYWRMQRRLAEETVRKKVYTADGALTDAEVTSFLKKWAADYNMERGVNGHTDGVNGGDIGEGQEEGWSFDNDDRWVFQWLEVEEDAIDRRIEKIRMSRVSRKVAESCKESKEAFVNGIESALRNCKLGGERAELVAAIEAKIGLITSTRAPSVSSSLGILGRLSNLGWDREKPAHVGRTGANTK